MAPTPTATPSLTAAPALAPLSTDDPLAFISELSEAEKSCLAGNVDPQQVMALLGGAPDAVSAEEIAALSQCLEDETLLRLFLTGVIG